MILRSPEGDYEKEMAKWEAYPSQYDPFKAGRPFRYQEFPKMLYKAGRDAQGCPTIVAATTVEDAREQANMESRGFRVGQDVALEALHAADQALAELAANRAYTDRTMSAQAQAEAARVEASTAQHLAEIPAKPIRKRGRRPKAQVTTHAD